MRLKPIIYRLIVKVEMPEELKTDKIILLEKEQNRNIQGVEVGEIVDIGPNAFQGFGDGSLQVKIGDKVFFKRYAGIDKEIDGEHYRIINDEEVYAKLGE